MGDRSAAVEREVKLGVWAGLILPDLDGVAPGVTSIALAPQRLTATYYDTDDLRLARWGVTVRHRTAEAPPRPRSAAAASVDALPPPVDAVRPAVDALTPAVDALPPSVRALTPAIDALPPAVDASSVDDGLPWTIKLGAGGAPEGGLARRELGFAGRETRPPKALGHIVRGLSRNAPLHPVARLRTDRRRWRLSAATGEPLCEIDDDEVSVLVANVNGRGRRLAARFRELEVELAPGADPSILDVVVARLREAGADAPDPTPKVVRALGPRAVEPPDVMAGAPGRDATAGEVVRVAIASSVERLFRHDPGVRLGDDPEDVHQARVATRRLRSDLRTFGELLDERWTGELRDELGWVAALLGDVRDTDVLLERLRAHATHLAPQDAKAVAAILRKLVASRDAARTALLEGLDCPRYTTLLDRLVDAARAPKFATAPLVGDRLAEDGRGIGFAAVTAVAEVLNGAPVFASVVPTPDVLVAKMLVTNAIGASGPADVTGLVGTEGAGSDAPDVLGDPLAPAHPVERSAPEDVLALEVLPALVRRPWRHLEKAVAELGQAPADEQLHEVRIRAKRCRYAAEAVAPVVGKQAKLLAAAVAELQGTLGDFHDAIVAEEWLRAAVGRGPIAQALAAGQLIAIERQVADAGRRDWSGLWKRASAKKLRTWLK